MVDDPQAPHSPAPAPGAGSIPLSARSEAASLDELRRAHRLLTGAEGASWERNLVTGEVWYSDNFFRVTGIAPTDDRRVVLARMHPDDRPGFDLAYERAVADVGLLNHTLRYLHHDNSWRWARLQGRVWPDANGRAERMVGLVIDVHEETLAREELQRHRQGLQEMVDARTASLVAALEEARQQRRQAEQANDAKSTFLAHMSHEIRTPLNGLLGLNELALREARSDQQRRYLRLALQSGRALLGILNDVLDFSRLNAGGVPPRTEAMDLAEVLATTVRQVMPLARTKGLGVMFDFQGPVTRVIGDAQRLQQIAANLLTNAVKYTEAGHIALTAVVEAEDEHRCRVELAFSDTGPGMSPEVAARVFEPFVQGDDSLARRHGGAGLGLSIARGLAESMNGQLSVETAPGTGACFRLGMPMRVHPGDQPMAQRPPPGVAWLVYNRPVPGHWLATRLGRLGWQGELIDSVALAAARAAALRAPPDPCPDLVVLAEAVLGSPSELAELRRALPDTRIVLLVRPDWNQPRVEAVARANDMPLVFMPLTPTALVDLLTVQAPWADPPTSGFAELDGADIETADVLIAEDNPVNQLIITEMVASLGLRPRLVENGAQALSACRATAPRLLLMDLQMPELDGLEATRRLRELQRLGQMQPFPIVALTAHATPQDRDRCMEAGMQGFLTKPISLGLLRSELRRWITL
jgi:signal transduction histidine kinase/CheY-like chemotaxis protein